ncbi:NUDIX domain-containing protein [bacterium]|nr:NUDIX domain-containing protein [bacterium]
MGKRAAGILLYRKEGSSIEVFLIHPGGPYWANKDEQSWSIPKGEFLDNEDPLTAAQREFQEETGFSLQGPFISIGSIKQSSGKVVQAWTAEGNLDASAIQSNSFRLEWPPRSGKYQDFPEADRGDWFSLAQARKKLLKVQLPFLENLERLLLRKSV